MIFDTLESLVTCDKWSSDESFVYYSYLNKNKYHEKVKKYLLDLNTLLKWNYNFFAY
jgi:hypothetical protein